MHRRLLFVTVIALLVAALASAISYDRWRLTTPSSKTPPKPTQQDVPTLGAASSSTSTPQLDRAMIALRDVAPFTEPTAMAFRHRDDRLYVAVRAGSINIIDDGVVLPSPLLDLSAEVSLNGERGLLGLAFSPDGEELYASFTDKEGR